MWMSPITFALIQLLNVLLIMGFGYTAYKFGYYAGLRDAERKQKMLMNYKKEIIDD